MFKWMIVAVALGSSGIATAETLTITGRFPADAGPIRGVQRLAVGRIDGREGRALEDAIAHRLEEPDASFALVSGRDGARDGTADAVLSGDVSVDVDESDYRADRDKCVEERDDKCVRRKRWKVSCHRRFVRLDAGLRLARNRDATVLYARKKQRRDWNDRCEDQGFLPTASRR